EGHRLSIKNIKTIQIDCVCCCSHVVFWLLLFSVRFSTKLRHPDHQSRCPHLQDQTVPYGTAPWGGDVPGISCQATIGVSLRDALADASQRHLARERASNFVTPSEGAKTSQTAFNLAPLRD